MKYVFIQHYNDHDLNSCLGIFDNLQQAVGAVYLEIWRDRHDDDGEDLGYELTEDFGYDVSYGNYFFWELSRNGHVMHEYYLYKFEEEKQ